MEINTYSKFAPKCYLAKCPAPHERGEVIELTTRYGKVNECEVHNLIKRDSEGNYYYSITRVDGFDSRAWAARRAEKKRAQAERKEQKASEAYERSQEGKDFLVLAEPIKIGHHSEKRHRALIERVRNSFGKYVNLSAEAREIAAKADYYEELSQEIIDLSMPESLDVYRERYEAAAAYHKAMKAGEIPRSHSYSLTYANNAKKKAKERMELAVRLWAVPEDEIETKDSE